MAGKTIINFEHYIEKSVVHGVGDSALLTIYQNSVCRIAFFMSLRFPIGLYLVHHIYSFVLSCASTFMPHDVSLSFLPYTLHHEHLYVCQLSQVHY